MRSILFLLLLGSCSAAPSHAKHCPLTGDPIDPAAETRTFDGKPVEFCCNNCVKRWDGMSHDTRAALVK